MDDRHSLAHIIEQRFIRLDDALGEQFDIDAKNLNRLNTMANLAKAYAELTSTRIILKQKEFDDPDKSYQFGMMIDD